VVTQKPIIFLKNEIAVANSKQKTGMNNMETNPNSWQSFDCDTEAGRLLRKLYTRTHNKPLSSYPKFKTNSTKPSHSKWFNGMSDSRKQTERRDREKSVMIPKRTLNYKPAPAIFGIDRRRSENSIKENTELIEEEPRPLPRKAISTEMEKRRLAMTFQFKGGNILPEAGTMAAMPGLVPLSIITGKATSNKALRQANDKLSIAATKNEKEKHRLEKEFNDLFREMTSKKETLLSFEHKNQSNEKISHLKGDIVMLAEEMKTIDELITMLNSKIKI